MDVTTNFKYISEKWLTLMKSEWKEVTYILNENRLRLHVYPHIGNKDITTIKRLDILNIIQKLQKRTFWNCRKNFKCNWKIYKYSVTYDFVEHNIIADIDKKAIFAKKIVTHRATLTKEKWN